MSSRFLSLELCIGIIMSLLPICHKAYVYVATNTKSIWLQILHIKKVLHGIYVLRNIQRMLHIPFFKADSSLTQSQKLEVERQLKASLDKASASIGEFINLGKKLTSENTKQTIKEKVLPFVSKYLNPLPYRVIKGYALLLMAANLVSYCSYRLLYITIVYLRIAIPVI